MNMTLIITRIEVESNLVYSGEILNYVEWNDVHRYIEAIVHVRYIDEITVDDFYYKLLNKITLDYDYTKENIAILLKNKVFYSEDIYIDDNTMKTYKFELKKSIEI